MKKIICLAAASMLAVTAFVSCGKDKDKSSGSGFEGKWAASEMTVEGQTMTSFNLMIVDVPLDAMFHIDVDGDGTFTVETGLVGMPSDAEETSAKGKWEKVGDDTYKISADSDTDLIDAGEEIEIKIDGDTFTIESEEDGEKGSITFKRVTEFATYDVSSALGGLADAFGGLSE